LYLVPKLRVWTPGPCRSRLKEHRPGFVRAVIDHLQMQGLTYRLAYTLCGVVVDLRISQTMDVPNLLARALLPPDSYV
jgi:acetamidase/formamidase